MFGPKRARADYSYQTFQVFHPQKWKMTPEQIQAERDAYDGSIAYIDAQLGALLDEMHKQGLLENTLVVITSDHGDQFGEHQLFDHGNSLYMQNLRVPLVLLYPPRIPAGKILNEPVSLRNLPITMLDIIGLSDNHPISGTSFTNSWKENLTVNSDPLLSEVSKGFGEKWYPNAMGKMQSITLDNYHYILEADGSEEFLIPR